MIFVLFRFYLVVVQTLFNASVNYSVAISTAN